MNRRRRRRKNTTTYILIGVAVVLVGVLCAVLLTQCVGGGDAGSQSGGSSASAPPQSTPDSSPSSLPPASSSLPDSSPSESVSLSETSSEIGSESETSSESIRQPQPPPVFVDGKVEVTVDKDGKKVTVTYKTNVESTVNAILSTSGDGISTGTFYDYFNRGQKFDWAVGKRQTYTVTSAGKSETFELPDPTKTYYLYLNAVENETDVWQTGVTVLLLREGDPTASAPDSSSSGSGSSSSSGG